jgi:hypothetical protein
VIEFMSFKIPVIAEAMRSLGYKGKVVMGEDVSYVESATGGTIFALQCFSKDSQTLGDTDSEIALVRFYALWQNIADYNELEIDGLCNWFNAELFLEADLYVLDGMTAASFEGKVLLFIEHFEHAKHCLGYYKRTSKAEIIDRHRRAIELIHGEHKDFAQAVDLYRQNAHLGFAGSQNNFGDLFEEGTGVPRDDLLAVYWYTRAAERGEPTAYLSLASILEGSSTCTDALTVAAKYAVLAADKLPDGINKLFAGQIRDKLAQLLDPETWNFAMRLAANFKPIYQEKSTMGDAPGHKALAAPGSPSIN